MIQPVAIPKDLPQDSALSYDFLRAAGIKHIQQLAARTWTDHNIHDPGITILEQLCYAITDLSYRIDNDIKDLLGSNNASSYTSLYSPATILTTNPVTLQDIRKVVIDVKGVKNAWVEKVIPAVLSPSFDTPGQSSPEEATFQLKGLYRVIIEKEESYGEATNVLAEVEKRLQACRSVCEDFEEISLLDDQLICLQGTIEVGQVEDMTQLAANVLLRAATCISPVIPFYTLSQMLDMGKRTDGIFDSPALQHGFILDEDLVKGSRKNELRSSDLIRSMMDEKAVLAVNEFAMFTGSETMESWVLKLDSAKTPKLQVRKSLDTLRFVKQGLEVAIDKDQVEQLYITLRDARQYKELPLQERDIVLTETADRQLGSYYSIQHQFPANYGLGAYALPDSAPSQRKAQANQLKGYLLFFEQLLANYFSQVAHFKDLVSFDGANSPTWFTQSLLDAVPGLEEVLQSKESYNAYLQEAESIGNATIGWARKNSFLNHLLARFSETFTEYALLLQAPLPTTGYNTAQQLIRDKSNFLRHYPEISSGRARAFDYTAAGQLTANLSGLETRIALKLGIAGSTRRQLAAGDAEGFHMVEHILLRPRPNMPMPAAAQPADIRYLLFTDPVTAFAEGTGNETTICTASQHGLTDGVHIELLGTQNYNGVYAVTVVDANSFLVNVPFTDNEVNGRWQKKDAGDPYSLQLTFVLPDWVHRYQDENFKRFVERTIREETPVHITTCMQWLNKTEMEVFEQVFRDFLAMLSQQ